MLRAKNGFGSRGTAKGLLATQISKNSTHVIWLSNGISKNGWENNMIDYSWPVLWDARTRSYLIDVDGSAQGRFVGSIVHYPDEQMFAAYRYLSSGPVKLDGDPHSHHEALALFYKREKVPAPPPGWLRRRFMR